MHLEEKINDGPKNLTTLSDYRLSKPESLRTILDHALIGYGESIYGYPTLLEGWACLKCPVDKELYAYIKFRGNFVLRVIVWRTRLKEPLFELSFKPNTLTVAEIPFFLTENKTSNLHGISKIWHKNGALNAIARYQNGKLHGFFKTWDDKGVLSEHSNFKEGRRHGIMHIREKQTSSLLKSDQCWAHYNYKDGLLEGPFKKIHPDGKIWLEGTMFNGLIHGILNEYNDQGDHIFQTMYEEGRETWSRLILAE